jgi:hypothetical protein
MRALRAACEAAARDCSNFKQAARAPCPHVSRRGDNDRRNMMNGDTTMKTLILGAALALMAASPVLAQGSYTHRATAASRLDNIRAQAMPEMNNGAVYVDGQYVGADPDANVRLQMQKDYTAVTNR